MNNPAKLQQDVANLRQDVDLFFNLCHF